MSKFLRALLWLAPLVCLLGLGGGAHAQSNASSRPLRIIIPYPPGGGNDVIARILAPRLGEILGQDVIIDNRPGGNTVIGTDVLVKSAPDGHTVILVAGTHAINPSLLQLPYDSLKDFTPITEVAMTELVLVLNPAVQANNLQELIALAKSDPKALSYASSGNGSILNVAGEIFNNRLGIKIQHVPYKGSGQLLSDLLGGQVPMSFQAPGTVAAQVKAGKLRAIAISGDQRSPVLPDVPTFAEVGLPGLDIKTWYGVLAPAGTPPEVADRLAKAFAQALQIPEIKASLESKGFVPRSSTPGQFGKLLASEIDRYARIVKANHIRMD